MGIVSKDFFFLASRHFTIDAGGSWRELMVRPETTLRLLLANVVRFRSFQDVAGDCRPPVSLVTSRTASALFPEDETLDT